MWRKILTYLACINMLLAGFGAISALAPSDAEARECFKILGSGWGKHCNGDTSSLELTVQNMCVEPMSLLYCFEQEGGGWDCKIAENIGVKATATVFSCKNTGNYRLIACEHLRDCKQELKKQ